MTLDAQLSENRLAAALRGFGPLGLLAILVILLPGNAVSIAGFGVPVSAILVLVWVRLSHTPWREIGYVRPRSWALGLLVGVALGVSMKFLMKAAVMPLLGGPAVNPAYHYLAGNTAALPGAVFTMVVVAGFGEETTFRGYMFERLGKLFGPGAWAKVAIVLVTSTVFGLEHLANQGLAGTEQAALNGLVFGTIMALTGRIWMLMCAHAAFDLTALARIYLDRESQVAHWIFR
ncbi:MAG: type II CAAX endopeptidase family protein [Phenylobacterium sp.]